MGRQHYSRRHYTRLSNGGLDAPDDVERRAKEYALREQANREMMERFPSLEPSNIREALDWQANRIRELLFT